MKIWLFSDLHLEVADLRPPLAIPDADVCVVAGDLCRAAANGVHWLAANIAPSMPCVYVAGNHEFYKGAIKEGLVDGRAAAARFAAVHFLENQAVVIGDARFLGASLWTDYCIMGHQRLAMMYAKERMNDYRQIAFRRNPWQRFLPETAYGLHQESKRFIEASLRSPNIPTVVVTHHLPHPASIPERFARDPLNAAYASDLTGVIQSGRPTLWIHGHTHDSCDYWLGGTRVVCNPRGYDDENRRFDPAFVVEI
ncbi:metallophosphoesterase [Mesorhizobium sp. VK24D]|uniref:Metallophosphoesterase n=1 Tax=Mesorhizobium album TaxID=3072314 RepID=A0ABU4Y4I4_9HYPH|nr:metallophosphoesterase [Mesorhizobium sp. VK24D]MDX8481859.1 metallophosphoesterase [Mesorhizobium sp. VK24D]